MENELSQSDYPGGLDQLWRRVTVGDKYMNIQKDQRENPDLFPELQLATLKIYAKEWAETWPIIERIQLFQYSPVRPDHPKTRNFTTTYALLFDIDGNQADLTKFVDATRYNDTIRDQDGKGIIYTKFMRAAFKNVYEQRLPKDYQLEWLLVPKQPQRRQKGQSRKEKRPQRDPFHFEANPSWLLFDLHAEQTDTPAALESDQGNIVSSRAIKPLPQGQANQEEFIRSLSIAYENEREIKIKRGTQRLKTYSVAELGFRRESSKAWRALISILKSPDHSYHLGAARGAGKVRDKSYDTNRAILREISKKFVLFLNKAYKVLLPDNFNIFELIKNGPHGLYRLKFVVSDFRSEGAQYESLSKDELMIEIENLSDKRDHLKTRGDEDSERELFKTEDELRSAVMKAVNKKWLGANRAKGYLNPPRKDILPILGDVYEEDKPDPVDY